MNQQDLDNIIELQKEANSRTDNILFISVICQALLDATRPKVSNERTSITLIREEATAWFFASIGVTSQNFILPRLETLHHMLLIQIAKKKLEVN